MKRYCFDTSGLSNPLESMPEDIHERMWQWVVAYIGAGSIAVTQEIYDEMTHIRGIVGECINAHKDDLVLEINKGDWDWAAYTRIVENSSKGIATSFQSTRAVRPRRCASTTFPLLRWQRR